MTKRKLKIRLPEGGEGHVSPHRGAQGLKLRRFRTALDNSQIVFKRVDGTASEIRLSEFIEIMANFLPVLIDMSLEWELVGQLHAPMQYQAPGAIARQRRNASVARAAWAAKYKKVPPEWVAPLQAVPTAPEPREGSQLPTPSNLKETP